MDDSEIQTLPALLDRAAASLATAKNSAEILEAHFRARVAYEAAERSERFARANRAHADIIVVCRQMQADAVEIEMQAQCRLADEYDAAQERGEVKGHGNKKSDIPNENITPTVTDIGLTSKQVHEARQVRDAEKTDPGIIHKAADAAKGGEGSVRAAVRRTVKSKSKGGKGGKRKKHAAPKTDAVFGAVEAKVRAGETINRKEVGDEHGVGQHAVQLAVARAEGKLEAEPQIKAEDLSLTAQQKLDIAVRQYRAKLDAEFQTRVSERVTKWAEEYRIPTWTKMAADAERVVKARKGAMKRETYRLIIACLHPDSRGAVTDKRLREAFEAFNGLELVLVAEKELPTPSVGALPTTMAEFMALKEKHQAERRAKRAARGAPAVRA